MKSLRSVGTEPLGQRVGYELKKVQHSLRTEMDETLRKLDITTPQYVALSVLSEEPGLSNAALARRSFVTPQTMNQIVVRLERAGLIERRAHPEHGRVLQAYVTEKGEKVRKECSEHVNAIEGRMVSTLTEKERADLLELLTRCSEAITRNVSG